MSKYKKLQRNFSKYLGDKTKKDLEQAQLDNTKKDVGLGEKPDPEKAWAPSSPLMQHTPSIADL